MINKENVKMDKQIQWADCEQCIHHKICKHCNQVKKTQKILDDDSPPYCNNVQLNLRLKAPLSLNISCEMFKKKDTFLPSCCGNNKCSSDKYE